MLINCSKCQILTPEYVNTAPASNLRQLKWVEDDLIGELPSTWNHLTGYEDIEDSIFNEEDPPFNIHYTLGGPWWSHYKDCKYSKLWVREFNDMTHIDQLNGDLNDNYKRKPNI